MQLSLKLKNSPPFKPAFHIINNLTEQLRKMIYLWRHNYISRRELAQLSPEQLKDIGKTNKQTKHEAAKPFWLK